MENPNTNDERPLTILLVEDDTAVCAEFISYIDRLDDADLVGVTNSSYKALELIRDNLPDALILDLELHNGSGNGLLLLNDLHTLDPYAIPYTIITTNNSSTTTYDYARQLGADFIFSKHQPDYSPRSAVDFLRLMRQVIQNRRKTISAEAPMESHELLIRRRTKRIRNEFDTIGISNKSLGYKYLVDAINIFVENPAPNLAAAVAKQYGKTASSVERAMQNAIERTWNTTPINVLLANYTAHINPDREMPTIMEFVSYYSNIVKNDF